MYHVSALGVDEHMINVHYYHYHVAAIHNAVLEGHTE